MSSTAIATMVKMMERLPLGTQDHLVEHMRAYLAELEDEALWDEQFTESQAQLEAAARGARQQIEAGKAESLDSDRL